MLRRRFAADTFYAPQLELGDGVVFLADSLHRTYSTTKMIKDRLSIEYRFFPGG